MELTLNEALQKAVEAYKVGQVKEADRLYTAIIQAQPKHPDANHNMGVLAVSIGKVQEALPFFKTALEANPSISQYCLSFIDALIKLDRITEAKAEFDQAKSKGANGESFEQLERRLNALNEVSKDPPQDQLNTLTNLYHQGQLQQTLDSTKQLLSQFPNSLTLYNIQGAANAGLGQLDSAIISYKQAIKIKPNFAQAYSNMGVALQSKGDLDAAIDNCQQAIKIKPDYVEAYYNLGNALKNKGDLETAIDSYKNAIKIKPDYAVAYNNMGIALKDKGDLDAAIDSYKQALKINPDFSESYNNMGVALQDKGGLEAAIDSFKQALKIKPDYAETYYNMAVALQDRGDLEAAIGSYQQALKIKPDYAEAYNNMGNVLKYKGDLEAAIDSYKQALKIKPDFAEAHNNIGVALFDEGDLEAALDSYQQALSFKPDNVESHNNIGNVLKYKGDLEAAIESYKQALKIKPDSQASLANKLHLQSLICDWAGLEQDPDLIGLLGTKKEPVSPWGLLTFEDSPRLHRIRSEIFTVSLYGNIQPLKAAQRPNKKPKKLRIGYFSADFHEHAVAYLLAKILEVHDRDQFEIYGYSIGPAKEDNMRKRITKSLDVFINVKGMSDREIALLARNDKIDIAIDLTGYTKNNRAGIFAYRAAPVQMNYLGYSVTMGANFIDYIIADPVLIPRGNEHYYSEQILRLPHTFMPADNSRKISVRQMSRSEMGLPEEGFVFCCFNNNYKISPRDFDMWMGILLKVEGSVLWLRNSNAWSKDNLCKEAEIRGVDPSRLIFAGRVPMEEHLARHKLADLFLDTFAFNAHTTASEALWAGLPIVTKAGKGSASRAAASLLTAVGLPELITQTEKDYETLTLQLAKHPEQLMQIRQKLMDNRLSTPLFDTELYTKHLEEGYQQAYQRYFDGKLPKAIFV